MVDSGKEVALNDGTGYRIIISGGGQTTWDAKRIPTRRLDCLVLQHTEFVALLEKRLTSIKFHIESLYEHQLRLPETIKKIDFFLTVCDRSIFEIFPT